jgi:hypothetical protein
VSAPGTMLGELAAFARYTSRLRRFLREPLSAADCRRIVEERLRARDESFLGVLDAGIFAQPASPYLPLLRSAGVEYGDVASLVRRDGVETALERLHDAGVYVTLEEYKGRRPIERLGLGYSVRPEDFFSPLRRGSFVLHDVGSSGVRRGGPLDLVHVGAMATHYALLLESFGLRPRPYAIWCPVPPSRAGLIHALRVLKLGARVDRWFSQTPLQLTRGTAKPFFLTHTTIAATRRWGNPLPRPEHVPLGEASPVAEWLAGRVRAGTPAQLFTYPSSAVRACLAAEAGGLDIAGTVFCVAGEPYTSAKAEAIERSGSRAVSYYGAVETGTIGLSCAEPRELDDVHLLSDRLGVIQRERVVAGGATRVGALVFTTLLATAPRLLLNVESDDYGVLEERACGCLFGRLGFTRHLHGIHSYDKLTSGGMTFVGSDLGTLLEQTLPARFGGAPTDYQLVEEEHEGIPRVGIVVSPRVGKLDESAVIATVLAALAAGPAYKQMMASVWETGDTLRVVRREPHATATAKVLPLHLERLAPPEAQ